MKYALLLQMLEWAARSSYGRDLLDYLISKAREWAEDDGKEDWDDYAVDFLEAIADYLYEKYTKDAKD